MSFPAGTRLGPYEIVAPLGAGGMGEVYRARDTRLGRDVAIKTLPAALAGDPHFRERFEREARSISSLSHPHICALYDVGHHDGVEFLVMELLEGGTLAARLEKGALPVADALRIGIEIAGALDKAHRQGIVHRDLKPGNVMLTKTGAKLLDFGLAKLAPPAPVAGAVTMATMTSPPRGASLTAHGTILGTFQYMAPEQIEGDEADARADIFAFGSVLFEMLTGRRAFSGKSQASLLGAILKDDPPPVSQLQPVTPPALDHVVRTCLAKDRDARFQTAHDVLLQLRWIAEGGSAAGLPAPVVAHRRRRERGLMIAIAALAVMWLATLVPAALFFRAPPEAPRIEFEVATTEDAPAAPQAIALSPDGRALAYTGATAPGSSVVLWIRRLDTRESAALPGTEGAALPFWSPDGRHVGFFASGKLKRIPIDGGLPQDLCGAPRAAGTWGSSGVIVFSTAAVGGTGGLWRVPEGGGEAVQMLQPDPSHHSSLRMPSFLPDGRRFLYLGWSDDRGKRGVYAGSLDGAAPTLIVRAESMGMYSAPGFLWYHRDGTLLAQPFDAERLRVTGEPIRVADNVLFSGASGRAAFTVSQIGIVAFRAGSRASFTSNLAWFNRAGKALGTAGDPASYNQIRLSPDEKRVAVTTPSPLSATLSTIDLRSNIMSPLHADSGANDPLWSPDGSMLMFDIVLDGKREFHRRTIGGRDAALVFASADNPKYLDDWSHDGKTALFHVPGPGRLFALPLDGAPDDQRKPVLLYESREGVDGAHFSPDDKWVAYLTNESGEFEVWAAAFPAFDKRRKVSVRGGGQPFWRGDGKELFYLAPDGRMMSAAVSYDAANGTLEFGAPAALFQSPLRAPNPTIDQYAVTKDGQRFLFIQPQSTDAGRALPITVIVNWPSGVPRQ